MSDYEMTRSAWLSNQRRFQDAAEGRWGWPLDQAAYARDAELSAAERAALATLSDHFDGGRMREAYRVIRASVAGDTALSRLVRPLCDALDIAGALGVERHTACRVVLQAVSRRQVAYWGWTCATWLAVLRSDSEDYRRFYHVSVRSRRHVVAISYLLGACTDFRPLQRIDVCALASAVFGVESVENAIGLMRNELLRENGRVSSRLARLTCQLLLANRSPLPGDLSHDLVAALYSEEGNSPTRRAELVRASIALSKLGIIERPLAPTPPTRTSPPPRRAAPPRSAEQEGALQWARWCRRWREASRLSPATRQEYYHYLLKIGRWLAQSHPGVTSPDQWNVQIALECREAIGHMVVGEFVLPRGGRWSERKGLPLSPATRRHYLLALRTFFRDCQRVAGLSYSFDPRQLFASSPAGER